MSPRASRCGELSRRTGSVMRSATAGAESRQRAPARAAEVGLDGLIRRLEELASRHDEHVDRPARSRRVMSKDLSNQTFGSVSGDGNAELFGSDDPETRKRAGCGSHHHGQIAAVDADALVEHSLELTPAP